MPVGVDEDGVRGLRAGQNRQGQGLRLLLLQLVHQHRQPGQPVLCVRRPPPKCRNDCAQRDGRERRCAHHGCAQEASSEAPPRNPCRAQRDDCAQSGGCAHYGCESCCDDAREAVAHLVEGSGGRRAPPRRACWLVPEQVRAVERERRRGEGRVQLGWEGRQGCDRGVLLRQCDARHRRRERRQNAEAVVR